LSVPVSQSFYYLFHKWPVPVSRWPRRHRSVLPTARVDWCSDPRIAGGCGLSRHRRSQRPTRRFPVRQVYKPRRHMCGPARRPPLMEESSTIDAVNRPHEPVGSRDFRDPTPCRKHGGPGAHGHAMCRRERSAPSRKSILVERSREVTRRYLSGGRTAVLERDPGVPELILAIMASPARRRISRLVGPTVDGWVNDPGRMAASASKSVLILNHRTRQANFKPIGTQLGSAGPTLWPWQG
jgi:hypothetical protein